jgi:hypothetical protein
MLELFLVKFNVDIREFMSRISTLNFTRKSSNIGPRMNARVRIAN